MLRQADGSAATGTIVYDVSAVTRSRWPARIRWARAAARGSYVGFPLRHRRSPRSLLSMEVFYRWRELIGG